MTKWTLRQKSLINQYVNIQSSVFIVFGYVKGVCPHL